VKPYKKGTRALLSHAAAQNELYVPSARTIKTLMKRN